MQTQSQSQSLNKLKESFVLFQTPFKEFTELNLKTLRNISYVTPEELLHLQKPEAIVEKQVEVFIDNSHKTLDYFQKAMEIFEKNWLSASEELKKNTKQTIRKSKSAVRHASAAHNRIF